MQRYQSWLFVPGHQQTMLDKAPNRGADALIYDLEDGVPPAEKATARTRIAAALPHAGAMPIFVRTHPAGHANLATDLAAIVGPGLAGIVLPKVNTADEVIHLSQVLTTAEEAAQLPGGHIRILALIETALGLVQAPAIAAADSRMTGLLFGAEDFALDTHADSADDFLYARSALVVAAASAGIQVIDRADLDLQDLEGLSISAQASRRLGFTGKLLIHPRQIGPVHDAFCPWPDEVTHAERVLTAFNENSGSIVVDGRMVDLPVVDRARQILALYNRRHPANTAGN